MNKEGVAVFCIWNSFFKKMRRCLTAVKNINYKNPKFIPHRRGRWMLLPWTQVEHKRQGGCAQTYLQKYSILFLGSVPGCWVTEAGGKHKEAEGEGEEQQRHEAVNRNSFSERLAGWRCSSPLSALLLEAQAPTAACYLVIHFLKKHGSDSSGLIKLFILLY